MNIVVAKHSANSVNSVIQTKSDKKTIREAIDWHLDNKVPFTENVYRVGSENYFELFREARKLASEGKLELQGLDKSLIEETEIGKFAFTEEGQPVPLDCPMIMEERLNIWKYNPVTGLWKIERDVTPETKDKWLEIYRKDDPKGKYVVSAKKPSSKAHLKEEDEKNPPLNKPKRGGPKKFYVYVRKPDGGIKKVTWGDTTGLTVKLNDPQARKSFAARHQCDMQNDKTTAAYWACRTPYYAKQLGLSGGGQFFW